MAATSASRPDAASLGVPEAGTSGSTATALSGPAVVAGAMARGSSEAPPSGAVAAGSAPGVSPVEPAAPCSPAAFGCPIPDRPVPDGVEPVDAGRLTPTVTDSNCSTTPTLHGIAIETGT